MLKLQNFKEHGNKIVFRLCNAVLKALNSNKTLFAKFTSVCDAIPDNLFPEL